MTSPTNAGVPTKRRVPQPPTGSFLRERTLFEVYEDLIESRRATDRFYCLEVHSKRLRLAKNSCFIFREDWPTTHGIRSTAIWICEWPIFERSILLLIGINALSLALPVAYDPESASQSERDFLTMVNLVTMLVFTLECFLKMIARGIIFSPAPDPCYLRDPLNWLDFIVVVSSWFEVLLLNSEQENKALVLVRTLRVLRPLRSINALPHLRMTVVALLDSTRMLGQWLVFMAFFMMLFAILGNSLFSLTYWQRCRLTPEPIRIDGTVSWPIDPSQEHRLCGSRYTCQPTPGGQPTYCRSPVTLDDGVIEGYDPWPEIESSAVTNYGVTGFQSFFPSQFTVFMVTTQEGWTDLLYNFQDVHGAILPVAFFGIVVLGGLILLNIVLAILWDSFHKTLLRFHPLRIDRSTDGDPFPEDITSLRFKELVQVVLEAESQIKLDKKAVTESQLGARSICLSICNNPYFENAMLLMVCLNSAILASDHYPVMQADVQRILDYVTIVCSLVFVGEVSIKLVGMGLDFFDDHFNTFDFIFALATVAEFFSSGNSAFSALRTARLLRLFRLVTVTESVRVLFTVLRKAIVPTYNFCILVFMLAYTLVLLGMQLFYSPDGHPIQTTLNFDTINWSFVAVFALIVGEDWSSHMLKMLGASVGGNDYSGTLVLPYFIFAYTVGHLILMRLFVGIIVATFQEARDELLHSFRQRLFDIRYPLEGLDQIPDEAPVEEDQEEEVESPRWPDDAIRERIHFVWSTPPEHWVIAFDEPKADRKEGDISDLMPHAHLALERTAGAHRSLSTKAFDMQFLKMMRVKQAAASRKWKMGEKVVFRNTFDGLDGTCDFINIRRNSDGNLDSEEDDFMMGRSVSFAHANGRGLATIGERGDDEAPQRPPALAVPSAQHRRTPPATPRSVAAPWRLPAAPSAAAAAASPRKWDADAVWESVSEGLPECQGLRRRCSAPAPPPARDDRRSAFRDVVLSARSNSPRPTLSARSNSPRPTLSARSDSPPPIPPLTLPTVNSDALASSVESEWAPDNFASDVTDAIPPASVRSSADTLTPRQLMQGRLPPLPPAPVRPAQPPEPDREATPPRGAGSRQLREEPLHQASPPQEISVEVDDEDGDEDLPPERLKGAHQLAHLAQVLRQRQADPNYVVQEEQGDTDAMSRSGTPQSLANAPVRQTMWLNIALSPAFEPCIMLAIIISSIALAADSPYLEPDGEFALVLQTVDTVAVIIFLFEMVVKMAAYGVCRGPRVVPPGRPSAYFLSLWNWIDFVIIVIGLFDLIVSIVASGSGKSDLKLLRAIRVLRVVRPLRLVKKYEGLRLLVEGLFQSAHTLMVVGIIAALVYLGFGIVFVNMLKGALYYCSLDPRGELLPEIESRKECLDAGGEWLNRDSNFDNIGNSLLTLLHISTGEGWLETLVHIVDSRGIDLAPKKYFNLFLAFPVVAFVSLSNFFITNLIIGVLVDQYLTTKAESYRLDGLDDKARQWLEMQRQVFFGGEAVKKLQREWEADGVSTDFRKRLRSFVESRIFDGFILCSILANTAMLCIDHPTKGDSLASILTVGSLVCIVIFNIEFLLKLYAYRRQYFSDPWNLLDFAVVVASDTGTIVSSVAPGSVATQVLRAFRVGRAMRLTRYVAFMRVMVRTLTEVLPSLINMTLLLGLVIFMYACLGVGLFGSIMDSPPATGEHANFHSFGSALLLLFRGATGERWHLVMYALATDQPGCTNELQTPSQLELEGPRGCGSDLAYPFFASYAMLVSAVLFNLIIAVVLDIFEQVRRHRAVLRFDNQLALLVDAWRARDKMCTGFLDLQATIELLIELPKPIGFEGSMRKHVMHCMRFMPLHDGDKVHFRDIIIFVARRCYLWMREEPEKDTESVRFDTELLLGWLTKFPDVPFDDIFNDNCILIAHVIIASHVMRFVAKKRAEWDSQEQDDAKAKKDQLGRSRSNFGRTVSNLAALSRSKSNLDDGGGVGSLDGAPRARSTPWDPARTTEPSMLLTELAQPSLGQDGAMPQLSPLPWPPPLSKGQRR